jgi:hypothetical protein
MGKNLHVDLFKDMIPSVDAGIKELWDAAGEEGQKEIKGDLWNLNRYISSVRSTNREAHEAAILKTNEYFNKNFFSLYKNHPKLLWYTLCLCKTEKRTSVAKEWIGFKKKASNNKIQNFLEEQFPNMKTDEIELLVKLNAKTDIEEFAENLGMDDSTIKKIL